MDLGGQWTFYLFRFTDVVTINKFLCSPLLVSLIAYREKVTKPNLLGLLEKNFAIKTLLEMLF